MRVPFRHYLALTTVSTFLLILLGVYTGKIGAGLACEAQWPFCDGWMGLFPATWPSFVEWFHRLVAMIVGFMIVGAGIVGWRRDYGRHIRYALTLAVVLLPFQILFGANTVLNFGVTASMLHQTTAQLVFASMLVATTLAYWHPTATAGGAASATADD